MTPNSYPIPRDQENIFIWPDPDIELGFICTGKTGNTAIKAAALSSLPGGVDMDVSVHFDPRIPYVSRAWLNRAQADLSYIVVGVVRHPYWRLVSFWRDKIANRAKEDSKFTRFGLFGGMDFDRMVDRIAAMPDSHLDYDTHLVAQSKMLFMRSTSPNIILRFDHLRDDWARRLRPLSNDIPVLEDYNRTPETISYPEPDLKTLDVIYERYYHDFQKFGYTRSPMWNR